MKSKPQENKLETSCKDCMFAVYDGNIQAGCEAGRIEKFGDSVFEAYDDDKEFYVVKTVCNYFRENGTKTDLETVEEECKKTFSIVIYADEIKEKQVEKTKKDILKIDYDRTKFNVIVSQHHKTYKGKQKQVVASFCDDLVASGINAVVVVFGSERFRDHESFKHAAKNSFCSRVKFGQKIPKHAFTKINDAINKDLEKCVFFDCNGLKVVMFMVLNMRYRNYYNYQAFEEDIENEAKIQGLHLTL